MRLKILTLIFVLTLTILWEGLRSQNVGIGAVSFTPDASAGLDINFTNKGLLLPRVALSASNSNAPIGNGIATGLMVYNTDTAGSFPNQVVPGIFYWNGIRWINMGFNWHRTGNTGTTPGMDFIGTTDSNNLVFKINNHMAGLIDMTTCSNTFFGYLSGNSIDTSGNSNAFYGFQSGTNSVSGSSNIANGAYALFSDDSGSYNNALGSYSLYYNQGNYNVADGYAALYLNTTGNENVATGANALNNNASGNNNVAVGFDAAAANSSGSYNIAIGNSALLSDQSGSHNVAIGNNALYLYSASCNTAVGDSALAMNGGDGNNAYNTAVGYQALTSVTVGINNVGLGSNAGMMNINGSGNVFIGYHAGYNETGSDKLYIANSNTSSPLIGGDFSTGFVTINSLLNLTPTTAPGSAVAGTIYFDSSLNKLRCYDGTTWHNLW